MAISRIPEITNDTIQGIKTRLSTITVGSNFMESVEKQIQIIKTEKSPTAFPTKDIVDKTSIVRFISLFCIYKGKKLEVGFG